MSLTLWPKPEPEPGHQAVFPRGKEDQRTDHANSALKGAALLRPRGVVPALFWALEDQASGVHLVHP